MVFCSEGWFWFGCLPSLSSAYVSPYPLDRGCAGALPTYILPRGHCQWLVPGHGTLGSRHGLLTPPGKWKQCFMPGHGTFGVSRLCTILGRWGLQPLPLPIGPWVAAVFHSHLWIPRCQCRLMPTPVAHVGSALPWKKLLWWTCLSPHVPSNNGALPLLWAQASSWTPAFVVYHTLASSGCLCAANPSPLPKVWPPKPESQHPAPACHMDEHLRLVSANQHWSSVQVSLCFALCKPFAALSSKALKLPLCPGWSPRQWGDFPVCRKLSSFTALSQECRSHLYSFLSLSLSLFFLSYPVMWIFSCPFGNLRSFARVQ